MPQDHPQKQMQDPQHRCMLQVAAQMILQYLSHFRLEQQPERIVCATAADKIGRKYRSDETETQRVIMKAVQAMRDGRRG